MLVPTIGIEVHVELKSNAKVYSKAKNAYTNEPNSFVDIIDLGYPGVLPKLNEQVIKNALKACVALNCKINDVMHFDRKNYFYPDLPKGYQITQQDTPIGYDGYLEIEVDGKKKKIGIERIHIEEDTCKSIHSLAGTLLNFNRAGVPLIEIVSKPDIASPEEAIAYVEALRETLLYLGISDVKIEEGSMRCDTNISLKEENAKEFGTKVEIKNIGSITNVGLSLNYEIARQKKLIEDGIKIVEETRRYDDNTNTTILMRVKETGNDYRYFPEPDIPFIYLDKSWITEVKENMPKLPEELREEYKVWGLNNNNIKTLIANAPMSKFLDILNCDKVISANLLTGDILAYLNKHKLNFEDLELKQDLFEELVNMISNNEVSSKQVKELLPVFLEKKISPKSIAKELGLVQISDTNALLDMVKKVISDNPNSVEDYKNGLDRAVKYLMGQIMKASRGQANPQTVSKLLVEELDKIEK